MDFIYKLSLILSRLIGLYSTVIVIRIMFTWVQMAEGPVLIFLKKICDPYLNLFKSKKTQIGMVDFSPLVALMILNVLQSVFSMFGTYGHITIAILTALIIQGLWQYFISYAFIILLVLIALRWFAGRKQYDQRANVFINRIEPVLYKPVHFVYRIFYNGKNTNDQTIVLTAFFFYLVLYIALRYGINSLVGYLCTL